MVLKPRGYAKALVELHGSELTVRQRCLRVALVAVSMFTVALAATPAASAAPAPSPAPAPVALNGPLVFPGMEILQDRNRCTLGYVDVATRTAFTAGHCRAGNAVNTADGTPVGQEAQFRDNTPDGATVATDHLIADWQTIALAPNVPVSNVLPGGRPLVVDPTVVPAHGERVCHFGVVTGESCGTVESVNNGWFTMANGVVSQKGDSGGPVYVPMDDGRAVIIGMFNSTWGAFPAAVSWQATDQQIHEDGNGAVKAAGTVDPASAPATLPAGGSAAAPA
jgi:hypothetical protein